MADLTAGQAAHLDRAGGKFRGLTIGTRMRNVELMTDPASAGQFKVVAGETITGGELLYMSGWNSANSCFAAKLADANAGFPAQAVALADITSAAVGYASAFGRIDATNTGAAVNTDAGAVGDAVFLSDTAGGWSLTESTTMPQTIGYVAVDSATVGVVSVVLGAEIADHTHATSNGMGGALTITTLTDLDLGNATGTNGSLDVFPTTTAKGKLTVTATDSTGDTTTTITNAAQATTRTYTIPDAGANASFVMTGTADQSILGDIILGSSAGAEDTTLKIFADTTASGSLLINAGVNSGNDVTTLQSATTAVGATGGNITVSLPNVAGTLLHSGIQDQSIAGDLALGSDTVAGTLTLNSITTSKGTTVLAHQNDATNKVTTLQNNPTTTGTECDITLPSTTGTLLGTGAGNPASDVTLGKDLILGADAVEGTLTVNSTTASKGSLILKATDNTGDDIVTLTNYTNTGAAMTATLPAFTGTMMVYESAQRQVYPFKLNLETGAATVIFANGGADGWTQETNEENVLRWNNAGTPTKFAAVYHIPNDLDDSSDVIIHFLGMPSSTTDSPTMTCEVYFSGVVGSAINADADAGGTSGEFTNVATWQEKTLTVSAADVFPGPCTMTVIFNPTDSELGTDDFLMASTWLEYTGTPLTS